MDDTFNENAVITKVKSKKTTVNKTKKKARTGTIK